MKVVWIWSLAVILSGASAGASKPAKAPPVIAGKVGLVTRDYVPAGRRNWRGADTQRLHVVVWYPADEGASEIPQLLGPAAAPLFEAGSAMPHAAFKPSLEKFPLILLSPGVPGPAEQMAWLGVALARAGFITAAVDHPGTDALPTVAQSGNAGSGAGDQPQRGSLTAVGYTLWWERATDLSDALDGLLADPELSKYIDRGRVGAAGFSLGGYTVLELAGARTDISQFYDMCRKNGDDAACRVPAGLTFPVSAFTNPDSASQDDSVRSSSGPALNSPEKVLEAVRRGSRESLARSGDSFKDPRVEAVLALAPDYAYTLTPESLRQMRLPVLVVSGAEDRFVPASDTAGVLRGTVRGGKVSVLPGVGHYTFLDDCTAAGKTALPQFCTEGAGVDREAVHQQVGGMAADFFYRALR